MQLDHKHLLKALQALTDKKPNALDELYFGYSRFVYNTALSITKNIEDANDIVQEVFIKLYKIDRTRLPVNNAVAWLYTLTKNMALQYLRKKKPISPLSDTQAVFDTSIDDRLFSIYLLQCLDTVEREIVVQHVLNRCKHKEIAYLLNISESTVRWKYREAIKKLKQLLKEDRNGNEKKNS